VVAIAGIPRQASIDHFINELDELNAPVERDITPVLPSLPAPGAVIEGESKRVAGGVTINSGPVSATDNPDEVPVEKWRQLLLARSAYISVNLPSDCEKLLQFVYEAEKHEMWKEIEHVDLPTGDRRPYENLDDFILNGLQLDPKQIEWAREGWRLFKPCEPVPFNPAPDLSTKAL
jgi:hypothetical protein